MIAQLLRRKFVRDTLALQIGKIGTTLMTLISSLLVVRLMGTENYGAWSLAQSFFTIWQALNLTGVNVSTSTRLAMAVGAKDEATILDLMAFYVQVSVIWAVVLTGVMGVTGPLLAGMAYRGDQQIGVLAVWLSLTVLPDAVYSLVIITLQSQRAMRTMAVLTNINQLVLLVCTAGALLISPTAESLVVSRLVYSVSTMLIALGFYQRERVGYAVLYPTFGDIIRRARSISPRPYWRFGFLNALDKNIANLYTEIPLQLVGIYAGKAAAGYLEVGFKALTIPATFTSAVADNLQAVIPQAVGRRDFVHLRQNLMRVLMLMSVAAIGFYGLFALGVPFIVSFLGARWIPSIPVITALSVYGAVTMVGGIFGPLYRALNLLRPAIIVKLISLGVVILPGLMVLQQVVNSEQVWSIGGLVMPFQAQLQQSGAVVSAWMVNGLLLISVVLTALVTLPRLRRAETTGV